MSVTIISPFVPYTIEASLGMFANNYKWKKKKKELVVFLAFCRLFFGVKSSKFELNKTKVCVNIKIKILKREDKNKQNLLYTKIYSKKRMTYKMSR